MKIRMGTSTTRDSSSRQRRTGRLHRDGENHPEEISRKSFGRRSRTECWAKILRYISVAVDPNPNAEEATICMLGKTEDAVGNAKDAFEALALGAESHPG